MDVPVPRTREEQEELLDDLQSIVDSIAAGAVDAGSQTQRVLVGLIESLETDAAGGRT